MLSKRQTQEALSATDSDSSDLYPGVRTVSFKPATEKKLPGLNLNLSLKSHSETNNELLPSLSSIGTPSDRGKAMDANVKKHLLIKRSKSFEGGQSGKQRKKIDQLPANPIYIDQKLHEEIILFLFDLIIKPQTGTFDPNYVVQFPVNNSLLNIPFILHQHLNSPINTEVTVMLLQKQLGKNQDRLLKLLVYKNFNSRYYPLENFSLLAKGAYGEVYYGNVYLTKNPQLLQCATPVAIKLQLLRQNENERCVLHDLYNEITVMERL